MFNSSFQTDSIGETPSIDFRACSSVGLERRSLGPVVGGSTPPKPIG